MFIMGFLLVKSERNDKNMEKKNICRAITFYNNFIPVRTREINWKFCAFGMIDGIDVDSAFISEQNDTQGILDYIWTTQKTFCKGLEGYYTAQQIYAIRYDNPNTEDNFWEQEGLPFYFFCRFQYSGDKKVLWEGRTILENSLKEENKVDAISYLSFDNSDLLIVLRTSEYNIGASIINELRKARNPLRQQDYNLLKNSFTTFAICYQWIEELSSDDIKKLDEKTIECVHLDIMERQNGNIGNIRKELQGIFLDKLIGRTPVLGTVDEILTLNNIGWGSFLKLYRRNGNFFCNTKNVFNENANTVTTTIHNTKIKDFTDRLWKTGLMSNPQKNENKEWRNNYECKVNNLREKFRVNIKKQEKDSGLEIDGVKELDVILNALPRFNGEAYNDYIFLTLLEPLDILLELLLSEDGLKEDRAPFYNFLKGFTMYVQGIVLSDRYVAQSVGFNTRIYDIPVKLCAFYNAFLYQVKELLNTDNRRAYGFIAMPGMSDIVNVTEVYRYTLDNKRLLQVEIPESYFYKLSEMMIILSHEAAHYVGKDFRNRTLRKNGIIKSYCHIFICFIRSFCDMDIAQDVWDNTEKRLESIMHSAIKYKSEEAYYINVNGDDADIAKDIVKKRETYGDHYEWLRSDIVDVMSEILGRDSDNIFASLYDKLSKQDKTEFKKIIEVASYRYLSGSADNDTRVTSENVLNVLGMLYHECFADLMAIIILDITPEDYLMSLISNSSEQGWNEEELKLSDCIYRVMAVIGCMIRVERETKESSWTSFFGNEVNFEKIELGKMAMQLFSLCIHENKIYDNYDEYMGNAMNDPVILNTLIRYLFLCWQSCDKQWHIKENEQLKRFRKTYMDFGKTSENIENQIKRIEAYIEDYKKDLCITVCK